MCEIGYSFEEDGLMSGAAKHAVNKSMLILMFVERASKCALRLHSKLVVENNKILCFQNGIAAAFLKCARCASSK